MASARVQRKLNNERNSEPELRQQHSTSPGSDDVPAEIQCKICKRRYEDPKLLPCLHTFCKSCLERSYAKHGTLYCPACPAEINSAEFATVGELPCNALVNNVLQMIDLKNDANSKYCDSCETQEVPATSRCFECSDFLCDNCVEAHRRVRFTRQHRVASIKNLNADSLFRTPSCTSHAQESVKMFCKECKSLVCRSCIVHEHNDHVLVSLPEAVEDVKPKINTLLVASRARIPILQRKLKQVHHSQERLETKVDDVIKGIQATSARILLAVKRREKDLYRLLRRIHDKKSAELEKSETEFQNQLAQVLDGCEFTEELVKRESDVALLSVSGVAYERLRVLGEKEIAPVPEIQDDEIKYSVNDKTILDELKIYGEIMSRDEAAKKSEETSNAEAKGNGGKKTNARPDQGSKKANPKDSKESKKEEGKAEEKSGETEGGKKLERRQSWLETLSNPRALLRRLSFGGDESDGKQPVQRRQSEPVGTTATTTARQNQDNKKKRQGKPNPTTQEAEDKSSEKGGRKAKPLEKTSQKHNTKSDDPTKQEKQKSEHTSNQEPTSHDPSSLRQPQPSEGTRNDPASTHSNASGTQANKEPGKSTNNPSSTQVNTESAGNPNERQGNTESAGNPSGSQASQRPVESAGNQSGTQVQPVEAANAESAYESPYSSSSILKQSPRSEENPEQARSPTSWTVADGSGLVGHYSQTPLPTLNILTKNRRGRPREVEIQLESPDRSIISAQILDHKNGTYTIFYCPLSPGEHNLYVNVVGKNIKHGKGVLNFYGKFNSMGAEELFLTRRALSCIRWQVTPGFVEIKNNKVQANPDF